MNEEFKQLKKRIQLLEAKMSFHAENAQEMVGILKDMQYDIDAIMEVNEEVQKKNEERFERIEKHVGL